MSTRRGSPIAAATAALMCLCGSAFSTVHAADASTVHAAEARRELMLASRTWLEATLQGDFAAQARFYPERMEAFYLWRDVPKPAVIAEKRKVFARARTIRIDMESPQILLDADARSARMYFRKAYVIEGQVSREGEVLQELRWAKEQDGWKIVSERDLRVIRQVRR